MPADSRKRRVSDDAIVSAGIEIGLDNLTVRGVAKAIGASEMTLYRRVGGLEGLRRVIADTIIHRTPLPAPDGDDPEVALLELARALREFVIEHPGIAAHLADLRRQDQHTLAKVEESQRAFAELFDWPAEKASVLLSVVAEHAIALAQLNPAGHRVRRDPSGLPARFSTIRAGAESVAELSPEERFAWSMRATIRGAMSMLAL